jgi:hypothetical protein
VTGFEHALECTPHLVSMINFQVCVAPFDLKVEVGELLFCERTSSLAHTQHATELLNHTVLLITEFAVLRPASSLGAIRPASSTGCTVGVCDCVISDVISISVAPSSGWTLPEQNSKMSPVSMRHLMSVVADFWIILPHYSKTGP